jgi:hypothetical protein
MAFQQVTIQIMRCTILGALVFVFVTNVAITQSEKVKVEAVQLIVRKKPTIKGLETFGKPGLELQIAVQIKDLLILRVDPGKCRLLRFLDDSGVDLKNGLPTGPFHWVSLSNEFRQGPTDSALLDIRTRTIPGAQAKRVDVDAVIAVVTATGATESSQLIDLKEGAKISVGPVPMRLGSIVKSPDGGAGVIMQIASDKPLNAVREFVFLDPDGHRVAADYRGSGSMGFGDKQVFIKKYSLPKQYDQLTVRVVSYAEISTMEVPIKLAMGLGLSQ